MKKKILIIPLYIFCSSLILNAQTVSYEVSAGISSAYYYFDKNDKCEPSDSKIGFTGGLAINFKPGKHWTIQSGLSYVQKGGKEQDTGIGTKYSTRLHYIESPLNVVYSKRNCFFWGLGPFVAYGLSGKRKIQGGEDGEVKIKFGNAVNDLKPFEAGFNLLMGVHLPCNLFFSLNFTNSVNNISNDGANYFCNGYLGIKAGYSF